MAERQGHPVWAAIVVVATLLVAFLLASFALIAALGGSTTDVICFLVSAVTVLVGGLWKAWRVGTGYWGRRPAPTPAPARAPAPAPAVFVSCPGCGRTVNRQVGRCPYCQTAVEGGSDG